MSEYDDEYGDDLSSLLELDDDTLAEEIERRSRERRKPKRPRREPVGTVTAGPVKPIGIEAKEIARLATEGPLSQRIAAAFTIGRNDDLAKRAAPEVRRRTERYSLGEALADVALSQLPVVLGRGGMRAADEATDRALERYAEGGGDPGAHANLFGAAGALGDVAANVATSLGGLKPTPVEAALQKAASLPQRSLQAAKQGAATLGGLGAAGGATLGTDTEGPSPRAALTEGALGAATGAAFGAGMTALPELAGRVLSNLELKNRPGSVPGRKGGDPFSRSRVMGTRVRTPEGETRLQGDLPVSREVPVVPAALAPENKARVVAALAQRALPKDQGGKGGFTFDPHTGEFLTKGYAVALGSRGAKPLVTETLTPEALDRFVADNAAFFAENPDVKIGGWFNPEDGRYYIEPSEVVKDRRTAVALGLERGERTVGDLAKYAKDQNGDIPLELERFEHRSPVAGLTTLSGKFQGTNPGVKGAERARPKRTPRVYVQDVGSELEPEFRRGDLTLYHVEVPKGQLYDVSRDPDRIVAKVGGRNIDQWEKAIEKAGYAGYYVSEGGYPHYKTLFGDHPVLPPEGGRGALPPRPTPSAPNAAGAARPTTAKMVPNRTVDEVAQLSVRGRKSLEKSPYRVQIREAVRRGLPDVLDAIRKVPHAAGWYKADTKRMDEVMGEIIPELREPTMRQLFRAVLAITSSGQNPLANLKSAIGLFNKFLERDQDLRALSFFTGRARKIRTAAGGTKYVGKIDRSVPGSARYHLHEEGLLKLRAYLGDDRTQWAQKLEALWAERRPVSHTRRATKETLVFDQPLAAEIFGPKIGRYYANLSGVADDVTVDVWATRTLRRWLGYAKTGSKAARPPTDVEGNVMRAAVAELAKRATEATGTRYDPMEIQALLWYYEKQRYTDLGAEDSGQISYADAAERLLTELDAARPTAGHASLGARSPRTAGRRGASALGREPAGDAALAERAPVGGGGLRGGAGEPAGAPGGAVPGHRAGGGGLDPAAAAAAEAAAPTRGIGYEQHGLDLETARLQNLLDLQRSADDFGRLSHLFADQRPRMESAPTPNATPAGVPGPNPRLALDPEGGPLPYHHHLPPVNTEALGTRYPSPRPATSGRRFLEDRIREIRRYLAEGEIPGIPNSQTPKPPPTPLTPETRDRLTAELARLEEFRARESAPRLKNRGGFLDLSGRKPEPNEEPERVILPAYRAEDGRIFTAPIHVLAHEEARKAGALAPNVGLGKGVDGFVTSTGRFVDRDEAMAIHYSPTYKEDSGLDYGLDALDLDPEDRAKITTGEFAPANRRARIEAAEVKPNEQPVPTGPAAKAELKRHYEAQGGKGNPEVAAQAADYLRRAKIQAPPYTPTPKVDPDFGRRVAELYDAARSTPDDPRVIEAYRAMADEARAQYEHLRRQGVRFEFTDKDPYSNSAEMMLDVARNRRLKVFKTPSDSFHPLLSPEENDIFRAVHDYFGHAKDGNEFGPTGEENAYRSHASMFSETARRAMATETRGQNSWVNFGPHGEHNRANPGQTRYAEQKVFLLPDEVINAGLDVKPNEPRLKNRPGFLSLGGKPPQLPTRPEGTGSSYQAKVDVSESDRALANLAKLNLSPEAEAKVRDAYARLGLEKRHVTHEETRAVADELGLNPARLLDKEGRLSGAELLAIRDVISSNAARIVELSKRAAAPTLSVAEKDALLNEVGQLTGQNDEFLRRYTRQREQAGRDLAALKIVARNSLDPATWLLQGERLKGLPLTQEEHVRITQLISDNDRGGLIRYVASLRKSTRQDKLVTLWKAGLLTSLGTHVANVTGNAAMAVAESAKDVPAAMVDALLSLARGTARTKAPSVRGLVVEPVKGLVGPGFRAARRMMRYGAEPDQLAKWDFRKTNFGDGPAGRIAQAYTDAVFNSLGAEDQLFRAAAVGRSLEEQARLLAGKDKALLARLRKSPTPEMMVQAVADAEVATFQNPNLANTAVSATRRALREKGAVGQAVAAGTEVVAPFVKTPSNIVARTIEYSPPGLLYNTGKLALTLAKAVEAPDQKQLAEALGRGVVGSSTLFLLGFMLAREGKATGSAPKSPSERSQWELEGKIPNGVRIGNTWRSFARLGPPGMVVATGAQAYDAFANSETTAGKIFGALYAPVRAGLDQSFLQGASKALEAASDPTRAASRFVEGTVGSVIPSGVAQVARATDPYARETHGIAATLESRIPGLRQQLPTRLNAFGKPVTEGSFFADMLDPTRPTPASQDPLIRALEAADASVGFPSRTVTGGDGKRRRLTDEEYRNLLLEAGPKTERALRELMAAGLFSDARETPDDRREAVRDAVSKVRSSVSKRRRQRELQSARR